MKDLFLYYIVCVFLSACSTGKSDKEDKSIRQDTTTVQPKDNLIGLTLFKDYKFGQPMSDFSNNGEYEDCTDFFEQSALCKEGVTFLDNNFSSGLLFKDSKLEAVILDTEYDEEILSKILLSLPENNFYPVLARDSKKTIDIANMINTKGQDVLQEELTSLEERMPFESEVSISYVEMKNISNKNKKFNNVLEVFNGLPKESRELTINIIEDEDGTKYMFLNFRLAKNELNTLMKKESF
jgi:hypothetical protein